MAPTTVDHPVVAGPDDDALDDLPRGEPSASPEASEPTCSEGPKLGCFLWTIEEADRERPRSADMHLSSVARVGRGHVVTLANTTGRVTAYDLRDGIEVWSAPGGRLPDGSALQVVDDVVLHPDEEALVARDLVTGEERWRNPELVNFGVRQVEPAGANLLLAGHRGAFSSASPIPPGAALAAVDAATGELRWRHSGDGAAVAGGVGVVIDDGSLRSYDDTGTVRWEVDAGDGRRDLGIWVMGHTITIYSSSEVPRVHRLRDGQPLPVPVEPLTSDVEHTLVVELEAHDDATYSLGDEWILLDETGEVWRTPAAEEPCLGPVQFGPTTITLAGCTGETIVLDRADGQVPSRTPTSHDGPSAQRAGFAVDGYALFHEAGEPDREELVVVDGRTGNEVARLPSPSWPVGDARGGAGPGHDGVLVLQSPGWLVALENPA